MGSKKKTDKKQNKLIEELRKDLEAKGIELNEFINSSEETRKQRLRENYEAFKEKYQWIPDVPIPEPEPIPVPEPEPDNQAPVVSAGESKTVKVGELVTLDGTVSDPEGEQVSTIWLQEQGTTVVLDVDENDSTNASFTAPNEPTSMIFAIIGTDPKGRTSTSKITITVVDEDVPEPEPTPEPTPTPEPSGDVLYDSLTDSNLHDGKERTIEQEGDISAGGKGFECRASGNPRNVVNPDGTFSLFCDAGHGRDYFYVLNYNSTIEIEAAFWNEAKGQDLSLKNRSQHNEGGSFFGGYGLSIDRSGWGAKREPQHNDHDQSTSGKLPEEIETQKYFTIRFTVKDEGDGVRQIGEMNGKQFMSKIDNSPEAKMVDAESFAKQSYFWVRQNIDSGTGEIRIKRIRVLKA
jgi:hypothetical protein